MDESVIDFEPHLALFAEEEGLYFYKKIAAESVGRLNPGAVMILEFGYNQAPLIKEIFKHYYPEAGIEIHKDFNEHDRTLYVNCETNRKKEGEADADCLS